MNTQAANFKSYWLRACVLLVVLTASAIADQMPHTDISLTSQDKASIVASVLDRLINDRDVSETQLHRLREQGKQLGMLNKSAGIYLSMENLGPDVRPEVSGFRIMTFSPEQKVIGEDTVYLRFDKLEVEGEKVVVWLSERREQAGGAVVSGKKYEYRKVRDHWEGKAVGAYGT